MSILIEGMEMPSRCGVCTFQNFLECDVDDHDVEEACYNKERDKDCSLIEVPEHHGRLIDADEFLKRAIGTKCFRGDFALMLEELVGESTTVIPASEEG